MITRVLSCTGDNLAQTRNRLYLVAAVPSSVGAIRSCMRFWAAIRQNPLGASHPFSPRVPRPRHSAPPFIAEDSPCFGGGKTPGDLSPRAVGARGPGVRAIAKGLECVDPIPTMTFAGPETGLDLGRVQPAAVLGRKVRRQSYPQRGSSTGPKVLIAAAGPCRFKLSMMR